MSIRCMMLAFGRVISLASRAGALLVVILAADTVPAGAQDIIHSKVGLWSITYRKVGFFSGCDAIAQYQDRTIFQVALMQVGAARSWAVFISNPEWKSWTIKKAEHTLRLVTTRPWRSTFSASDDQGTLFIAGAMPEFVQSLARARSLTIANEGGVLSTLEMKDSAPAITAVLNCVKEHSSLAGASPETALGTGFFVAPNLVVTNSHVVKECKRSVEVRYPGEPSHPTTIFAQDNVNDLAVLHTDLEPRAVASFRLGPRLGQSVATYGFPYSGVLSSSGNFTLGNVTSLSGMEDNVRLLQVSAPIQPGNSGGAILDMSGDVIGVVVSQLDAVAMIQAGNSVPQNVNFAIQAPVVVDLLSAKGAAVALDSSSAEAQALSPTDVAEKAMKFTVQVYCQGSPK